MGKNGRYGEVLNLQEEGRNLRKRMESVIDGSLKTMVGAMVDMDADAFEMVSGTYHLMGDCLRYMEAYENLVTEMDAKLDKILEKLEER